MDPHAKATLRLRTSAADDWDAGVLAGQRDQTVSVVLPALNEEATVGAIVRTIRTHLMNGPHKLVDELVVLDSGSTDRTAQVARSAGAIVHHRDDVLPQVPAVLGKGEAMWRAVAATEGDIVVFIDADLRSFGPHYVVGLLGPLLTDRAIAFTKACYDRPLVEAGTGSIGGGRVTELVARPLLNLYWPELAGIIQPLAGEYAIRRTVLERLSFPCGYGVDLALLIDTAAHFGSESIAQVDLGVRQHRHHDDLRLGRMAAEIIQVAVSRMPSGTQHGGRTRIGTTLTQFSRDAHEFIAAEHEVGALERPPLLHIPEYAEQNQAV